MRTILAEKFGIEYPIFAFTHCRDAAAAVSRAGGIGILGAAEFTHAANAAAMRPRCGVTHGPR